MRLPFLADRRTDDHLDLPDVDDVVDVTAPMMEEGENVIGHAERGRTADAPWNIPGRGWKDVLLRVKDEWADDNVGMAAAAVAFYAFLALIPALAALVSILGLIARNGNPQEVIDDLFGALPEQARDLMTDQLEAISASSSSSLSFGLVIGVVLSIWTASGALGQLVNTINIVYDEEETRGWIRRKLIALGLTFGAIAFVAVAVFSVVALPAVIERTGLGIGTRRLLNVLIWPGLALGFMLALAVLYRVGPDRRPARWKWVSVGSVFALVAWIAVTLGFRLYVSQFGSYNETYGSLAGVIVSLFWLWLTAVIVLVGAEINAELEHQTAEDTTIGGDQPMGQRGAVKADSLGELQE
ncbi:MAG TPA: YihY/virulence factor BrkB family protein [Ilumatobacter sp.]|nr:YihY/virulence factor BrkB family protein [Ilumatobacter sp.]